MNYLKEFVILCVCLMLGVVTRHLINFPIPEAVYGMIYLFIAFAVGIIKPDDVKKTSNGILQNLAILFVPAGVGTAITMGLTGKIIEILQRRKDV